MWVDGQPHETGACSFAADLGSVGFPGGERLDFAQEAERARDDDLVLFASQYAQPFGTFTGTLPGGLDVAQGFGVMERHDVRW